MTTSPPPAPHGAQQPRLHSFPPYRFTAGDEAITIAADAGLILDPWQQLVLRDALGETADGKHVAFEVCVVVPRQNGKGSILEALELWALFFPEPGAPPPLILHSAHEFKTSAEHFRRMRDLIERNDHLLRQVRIIRTAAGSESIELHSGARLRFVTRTGGSGRGFSADMIVIDEAYNLTADSMAAVLPTLSARPNPQVWYTSSAGMVSSEQLARLRERGERGDDRRLAYFEWSAPEGVDLDDPVAWRQANPALGIRIPETFVEAERSALPEEQFARERLGIWRREGISSVIDGATWAALADPDSLALDPIAFAVDVTPDRSFASIAMAGRRPDGLMHVEVVDNRKGTGWVGDRLTSLIEKWQSCAVVIDTAGPAGSLLPALQERGIEPLIMTGRTVGNACGAFYDAVVDGQLRHLDDPRLNSALSVARKRTLGDAWAWHRRDSGSDITPLVAVTFALHGFLTENHPPADSRMFVFR